MNSNTDPKLIFVDVDGVLSAPNFGKNTIGMSEDDWFRYCVKYGVLSYNTCKPIRCVERYLRIASKTAKIFVLTAVASSFEADAKKRFVSDNYSHDIFDGFISVGNAEDKVRMVLAMAEKEGVSPSDCEIIDDDYSLLLKCAENKIIATHLANIAARF